MIKLFAAVLLLLLLLAVAAGIAAFFRFPRTYYSHATIEVPPENATAGAPDYHFMKVQLVALQKTETLFPVVDRLELVKAFSTPDDPFSRRDAYYRVKSSLKLQQVPNTSLIEIGVSETNPQRAADIANTIALVFQELSKKALASAATDAHKLLAPDEPASNSRKRPPAIPPSPVKIWEKAEPAPNPESPIPAMIHRVWP